MTMDRGYTDYALFGRWTLAGVFFVTRIKDNAVFTVEEEFQLPANRNILLLLPGPAWHQMWSADGSRTWRARWLGCSNHEQGF